MYNPTSLPRREKLPTWALVRRFNTWRNRRFEAAVAVESERRVSQMAAAIAAEIPTKLTARAESLSAQVAKLRAERKESHGFLPVAVRLRGFQNDSGQDFYVLVEVNRQSGKLQAAKSDHRQILHHARHTSSNGWFHGGGWDSDRLYGFTELGAPEWKKIDGEPDAVMLLGEIYRYANDCRMTSVKRSH